MAAESVNRLLAGQTPRLLICAGFAGGLAPQLRIDDLVVAENLSTPEVLAKVTAVTSTATPYVFGSIISRTLPVESIADKAALHRATGALAVDMESEAVAAVCRVAGVPLFVVRTISDPADAPLPSPLPIGLMCKDSIRASSACSSTWRHIQASSRHSQPSSAALPPARQALARFLLELDIASHRPIL